jgi:hypothetical protein
VSERNKRIARREARQYFNSPADVNTFLRQMGVEAHFDDLTSPAGAQGPAQFMPATAKSVGVKNVHDPVDAYGGAAKLMRQYLDAYHGDWEKALVAYNAGPGAVGKPLPGETRAYLSSILGGTRPVAGSKPQNGAQRVSSAAGGTLQTVKLGTATSFDQPGYEQAQKRTLLAGFLSQHGNPNSILFKSGLLSTAAPDPADFTKSVLTSRVVEHPLAGGGSSTPGRSSALGRVKLAPGADRAGVATRKNVLRFARKVAGVFGQPLTIGTGTNHSEYTVNGNVSDHWQGNAVDIPASGKRLTKLGQAALVAAGMDPKQARKAKGGIYNVGGHQVIFNTTEGGNHWNHLHISAR